YVPERSNIYDRKKFVELQVKDSKIWSRSRITKLIWEALFYSSKKKGYELFSSFLNTYASFTREYNSIEELNNDVPPADLYITGSDQVWNTQWSGQVDYPYYLEFVKDKKKKISYASSFGRDYLPDEVKPIIKTLLMEYRAISVRENSGKHILSDLGLNSTVVIDPTMLCEKSVWENLAHDIEAKKNYVILYQIKYDFTLFKKAKEYAKDTKKRLIVISLEKRKDSIKMFGTKVIMPEVQEFISYIKNADAIITDSFHACVFSCIFHTAFAVYISSRKEMSSRITELLQLCNLEGQIVEAASSLELKAALNSNVNWKLVDERITNQRKLSQAWLDKQLNETYN
ncbi:MAG: polysaccharide pyruvyl transferase family protein, partial [Lachnospiraceae bacterium]|nr:polysaccharide pyruvyl transferase family protein [Lachnospiraceae bacterium]